MSKVFISVLLLCSVSFAKVGYGTYACYGAALRVAANKLAKDSQDQGSILNRIGLKAHYCEFAGNDEKIICYNARDTEQFEAYLVSSKINRDFAQFTEMSFFFKTGTKDVGVYYNIIFALGKNANSCTYVRTYIKSERPLN